jgi:hypothetical protein
MTKARRPTLYIVMALRRRYGQALGMIAAGEDRTADLAHLGAVILMFAPDTDLAAIAPIRPYKPHRERWSRTALRILRTANHPLRATELARLVMSAHGVDPNDEARLFSISCGLQAVLGRLARRGMIAVSGKPRRWSVAS